MIEETADEEEKKAGADETMLETPVQDLDGSQPPPYSSPPLFLGGQDSSSEEEEEAEEQEEPDPEPTPQPKLKPQPKSKPAGKRAPPLPEPEEEEEEEDVDETPQPVSAEKDKNKQLSDEEREDESDSEVEEPTRRTTKKAPKATTTKKSSTTVRSSKPKPKPPKDTDEYEHGPTTFPVVVHRLAKAKGDAANTKLPAGSQRSGVNPVDVISQVSTELIDKLYQRLKTSAEKKAVESFKEELSLRFLELTDALEHSITLTDRVRKAQRRKNQLMGELLALKRERTQIAVQMDDVRRDHEAASKSSDTQIQTSQLFEEISGALERGKSRAQDGNGGDNVSANLEGLEGLVRRVSAIVTGGGGDGTGVLGKVVEFNRFLERAEKMLRERNAGIAAAR
ncbi:hypothetical protein L873DRAFT_1129984 [Choiromyces venosus 120613-1]|uniref:Inner kinetochore subunit AME1 domain-containing protein n=1 Tax=Choiromyces venosus 120613-1 TaxID=1336337 RepID=A0A3N4JGM0_9PEZI|nr:hypothetical protein L873DRAFT_1129984 [Choiromyces venosus 120613-1]